MNISTRYYRNKFPNLNDIVIVKIIKETNNGFYGYLLEYENLEGFVSKGELFSKGKHPKKDILKIHQIVSLTISRIDKDKKEIDLTRKRISESEKQNAWNRYKNCTCITKLISELCYLYTRYNLDKELNNSQEFCQNLENSQEIYINLNDSQNIDLQNSLKRLENNLEQSIINFEINIENSQNNNLENSLTRLENNLEQSIINLEKNIDEYLNKNMVNSENNNLENSQNIQPDNNLENSQNIQQNNNLENSQNIQQAINLYNSQDITPIDSKNNSQDNNLENSQEINQDNNLENSQEINLYNSQNNSQNKKIGISHEYKIKYETKYKINYETVMHETIWKIYDEEENPEYEQIYKNILENPLNILLPNLFPDQFIEQTYQDLQKRIKKNNLLVELQISLTISEYDAVSIIKNIFNFKIDIPTDYNLKRLIGTPPIYKIRIEGPKKNICLEILENISKIISESVANLNPQNYKFQINPVSILEDQTVKIKLLDIRNFS